MQPYQNLSDGQPPGRITMANHKDLTLNTKKGSSDKKGSPKKKILIIVLILILLVSGITVAYFLWFTDKPQHFANSELPQEIIAFSFVHLPELYGEISALDEEITYNKNEMDRIETVGNTYPDQKKIADTELKTWSANLAALTKCRLEFEKELKMIYVSYQVNPESGQALMDEKKEPLKSLVDPVVTQSKTLTDKLRAIEEAKGFLEKTTDKLFKK